MTAETWPTAEASLRLRNPRMTPEVVAELRREFERLQYDYLSHFLSAMPELYARYFSAEELREITAFYRTRTGAKVLQTTPYITAEFVSMVLPYIPAAQERVQQAFNQILRQRGLAQ
jgi:hypothetical protein